LTSQKTWIQNDFGAYWIFIPAPSTTVLGVSTNDLLSGMVTDVQFIITNLTTGGMLEYFSVLGLVLDLILKVILAFLIFVFDGFGSVLAALGFSILIWGPIQVIVDAVVIYDFAQSRL
jgi:hypothetical protein